MKKLGIFLIVLGLVIPTSVYIYFYEFVNWNPLNTPVQIQQGTTVHKTFKVNYTARYFADLIFTSNNSIPIEKIECLTGLTGLFSPHIWPEPDCSKDPRLLHFRWELKKRDGNLISQGTYGDARGSGGLSRDEADVGFAYFDAKRGDSFDLLLNFDKDASALNVANPVLCVSANSVNLESAMVLEGISPILGLVLIAAGVVIVVLGRSRNSRAAAPSR